MVEMDTREAVVIAAEQITDKGVDLKDSGLAKARLVATAGHVINGDNSKPNRMVVRAMISKVISYTQEVEIVVNEKDEVSCTVVTTSD